MSVVHFFQFILVAVILVVVGIPLFSKLSGKKVFTDVDPVEEEYKHLLVRKEEVLLSIKELEFDFKTDKVSQSDFDSLHHKLETEAMGILQRIEELEHSLKKQNKKPRNMDAA